MYTYFNYKYGKLLLRVDIDIIAYVNFIGDILPNVVCSLLHAYDKNTSI